MPVVKLCECGCGQPTTISTKTYARRGIRKGEPNRFLPRHTRYLRKPEYIVDEATGCWVWQRSTNHHGYGRLTRHGESLAHRAYYVEHVGPIPDGMEIDHICRNRACVNPDSEHMRLTTPLQNAQHRAASGNRDTSSRFRGVSYRPGSGWAAYATVAGVRHHLGVFETEEEAAECARAFRREHMPFSAADQAA